MTTRMYDETRDPRDEPAPARDHISPWSPEIDQIRLAVLGKLIEELNECAARAARCIIHGLDETDPDTGRTNQEELEREVADVDACIVTAYNVLQIDADPDRVDDKIAGFQRWHGMIAKAKSQTDGQ